ncbi:gliding motility-associated C-terminal domain-containing protein [Chitinophaga agrisoli]|uniref:Gliding motility-associated C-terminal domain-containing protein n=1 Tax=Chitinophaga agrisoli TaxID=2607653 RepID=A0A5B2VT93_9BACT|nr:CshA/CshB family fibrillar adhesin-related protein [Chitinophaga agrisoli]KAA2241506.1 gliding motility-associated C-terminal domain-containing protein [Chitinophaga agrisoli]
MTRTFYTFLLLLLFTCLQTHAQYADSGTGVLKSSVWWFNWRGFTISNGASKTFTTTDGLNVTITFSNVSGPTPIPSQMNTWPGAVLHFLYDFTDPNINPAIYNPPTTQNVAFTMSITATRNGAPAPFTLCAADAEASLKPVENTTLITSGSGWNILEFFRNSHQTGNPVTGCGTQTVVITDTHEPTAVSNALPIGQNPLMATNAPASGILQVEVHMDRMVLGGMAVAFGIFAPIDRGDLPPSYGSPQHRWVYATANQCSYNPPFPTISQSTALKLGNLPGDADPTGNSDDNVIGADEDALTSFPDYTGSGNYSLDVPVTNTTGANAYISGWFDYNRNGSFDAGEGVFATVPPLATNAHLVWTGLPNKLTHGTVRDFGFRFRISSDQTAVSSASGVATDGEVEDYMAHLVVPCDVVTFPTASVDMCEGASLQLQATPGLLSYNWTPATGLSAVNLASPIATPTANVTYTVMATSDDGCQGSTTIAVNVNPLPVITKSADASICTGANVQLSATSSIANTTFSWLPATGLNDPAIANPVATPQTTTTYTVTATAAGGCFTRENVQVQVRSKRVATVNPAANELCEGTSLTLEAAGGDVYQWLAPDNTPLGVNPQLQVTPQLTTTYTVNITDNDCGGTTTLQVPVAVYPLPVITKSADASICAGGNVQLSATSPTANTTFSWLPVAGLDNPAATNPVATPQSTTTYTVTATAGGGCFTQENVQIQVRPKRVAAVKPPFNEICKGASLTLEASGGDAYQWLGPDNTSLGVNPQLPVSPQQTITYTVNITDNDCGGTTTLQVPITVSELNASVTKSNDITCSTGPAVLIATGGTQYQWEPAPGLTDLAASRQTVAPLENTTYRLTVINGACSKKDSVTVTVDLATAISTYPLPNAFTPNNDGRNDCFGLKYWGPVTTLDFNIYNRWGELVFSTHNPMDCWDGHFKGQLQPVGSYVYWITAKTLCGDVTRKGVISLLQ